MRPGAAPLIDQLILDIVGPPIMAALWWLGSRGLGLTIQGGTVSERTKQRQKKEFWVLLLLMYVLAFGLTIYVDLTPP